jgi:response regulator RpfG family c-di-GMP phosphodiesterase
LTKALDAGVKQYELITAERELLEGTLNKSIQVLVDVLALVNLTAFSRSNRVKRLTREVAKEMGVSNLWEMEIAAMLSQIGCITVPEEILMKTSKGEPLNDEELVLYQQHPLVAKELISQIPRLEKVANIVAYQDKRFGNKKTQLEPNQVNTDVFGAQILKAVLDFDKLLELGTLPSAIFEELLSRKGWYHPSILNALKKAVNRKIEEFSLKQVDTSELKAGMLLDKPIFSQSGSLLLSEGQEITLSLILKLNSFAKAKIISNQIQVRIPVVSNK